MQPPTKYLSTWLINRPRHYCRYATPTRISQKKRYDNNLKLLWFRYVTFPEKYVGNLYIEEFIYSEEVFFMARAKSEWEFINIKLEKTDVPALEKYAKSHDNDPFSVLDEILAAQYKVSVSWVDKQNSYVVSVSGNENTALNNKCTMTSWSDSVMEALIMTGFKVFVVCGGKAWKDFEEETGNWG